MFYNADSGLYLTTHRPYDPVFGRFLSRDPIGEDGDSLGNLYVYVGDGPTNAIDPAGLAMAMPGPFFPLPGSPSDWLCWIAGICKPSPPPPPQVCPVNNDNNQDKPPPGSKPIDNTPWSGDHQDIKKGIGAGPADNVKIDPNNDVWGQNPDGSWTNHGPAGDYTGSGRPSGRRGKDRR